MESVNLYNALSTSRQYFCKKVCLQLTPKLTCWDSVLGREDCQVANSRSTGPRKQNTDDRNCSEAITRNDQLPLTGKPQMLDYTGLRRHLKSTPASSSGF